MSPGKEHEFEVLASEHYVQTLSVVISHISKHSEDPDKRIGDLEESVIEAIHDLRVMPFPHQVYAVSRNGDRIRGVLMMDGLYCLRYVVYEERRLIVLTSVLSTRQDDEGYLWRRD